MRTRAQASLHLPGALTRKGHILMSIYTSINFAQQLQTQIFLFWASEIVLQKSAWDCNGCRPRIQLVINPRWEHKRWTFSSFPVHKALLKQPQLGCTLQVHTEVLPALHTGTGCDSILLPNERKTKCRPVSRTPTHLEPLSIWKPLHHIGKAERAWSEKEKATKSVKMFQWGAQTCDSSTEKGQAWRRTRNSRLAWGYIASLQASLGYMGTLSYKNKFLIQ